MCYSIKTKFFSPTKHTLRVYVQISQICWKAGCFTCLTPSMKPYSLRMELREGEEVRRR